MHAVYDVSSTIATAFRRVKTGLQRLLLYRINAYNINHSCMHRKLAIAGCMLYVSPACVYVKINVKVIASYTHYMYRA